MHFYKLSAKVFLQSVQDDPSRCLKPPVDFRPKVPFWPGLSWPGQAKTELLFWSQREVLNNVLCHPVYTYKYMDGILELLKIEKTWMNRYQNPLFHRQGRGWDRRRQPSAVPAGDGRRCAGRGGGAGEGQKAGRHAPAAAGNASAGTSIPWSWLRYLRELA